MNEIINETAQIIQTPKERAAILDSRINANAQIAAESIVAVGKDLKAMRDEKLYVELGYESFEIYCKEKAHISQRSAYNFIKAYETYGEQLVSIQHLGITKLVAMTSLEPGERETLIESGEAENLSTRELEKRSRKYSKNAISSLWNWKCQKTRALKKARQKFCLKNRTKRYLRS